MLFGGPVRPSIPFSLFKPERNRQDASLLPAVKERCTPNCVARSATPAKPRNSRAIITSARVLRLRKLAAGISSLGELRVSFGLLLLPAAAAARFIVLRSWSWRRDLNPRPSDYKSDALPAELRQPAGPDTTASNRARFFLPAGTNYKLNTSEVRVQPGKRLDFQLLSREPQRSAKASQQARTAASFASSERNQAVLLLLFRRAFRVRVCRRSLCLSGTGGRRSFSRRVRSGDLVDLCRRRWRSRSVG